MRRVLLFLLLLGAGLLLLYWLDRLRNPAASHPAPTSSVPVETETTSQGVQLGGSSRVTHYDPETKRQLFTVESQDTRTEGDTDILTNAKVELFDPTVEGVIQTTATAERARLKRQASPGDLLPRWEYRVDLEGVQAQLLSGVPLAPLSFQAPTAVVDAAARRVLTEDDFTARSPELTIAGGGLYCELPQSLLEVARHGKVELRRESAPPATLSATGDGPLQVRREEGPEGPVRLEVWRGALLELGGTEPGRLVSEHLALRARPGGEPGGMLGIERIDADGAVDWSSGESLFQAARATASFTVGSRLERARLEGLPRAQLALKLAPGLLPAAGPGERHEVLLSGEDSLDIVAQGDGFELTLSGPSSVEARDFRLRSATGVRGFLTSDRRSARFDATGGVVVESGQATLETATFVVSFEPGADGETRLIGTASGGARLVGTLPAEEGKERRNFTLSSPEGLEIEHGPTGWKVLRSTQVEVSLDGPGAFRARADRVQDFSVTDFRFTADGGVVFEGEAGRFGGEHLTVLAFEPDVHFSLTGTAEKKAFYTGSYGSATALEVEVTGKSLHARGDVSGTLDRPGQGAQPGERVEFVADDLTFDESESPELVPGERLLTRRTTATGKVDCTSFLGAQVLSMRCERLAAEQRTRTVAGQAEPIELGSLLLAEGTVHAEVLSEGLALDCDRVEVERDQKDVELGFRRLVASGNVRFQGHRELELGGECEVLVLDADRHGSLEAGPTGRVVLFGREPAHKLPFRLTGDRVDFGVSEEGRERFAAQRPELRMAGLRARAEHLSAEGERGVELSGAARLIGQTPNNVPYTLDAERVQLVGRRAPGAVRAGEEPAGELDALLASGAVDFHLGNSLRARGDRLSARRLTGILRLDGAPATLEAPGVRLETEWVEFDPVLQILVATGRGRLLADDAKDAQAQGTTGSWSVDFLSASTLLEPDSVVLVIQEPLFRGARLGTELRASWAILWLNRTAFQDAGRRDEILTGLRETLNKMRAAGGESYPQVLSVLRSADVSSLVREVFFEGPVEVLTDGELLARADAIYLDAVAQRGWLEHATVNMGGKLIGKEHEKLIVKADWLRLASDGDLRADRATVTSCEFEEPHVRVVTGDLRIEPFQSADGQHFRLRLKDNRIEMYDKLRIPLPPIDVETDEELKPLWPTLSLANSARFGTLLSFAFTRPADKAGELLDSAVRGEKKPDDKKPRSDVDAHYKVDASYLGSRGALLDLGLEIEAKEDYWFDLYLGLAYDDGEDSGFIRVDRDDRDQVRRWLRSQSYFADGKNTWTFSYTDQSDAAVQSEFYESKFLRYERSETYAQWRRSSNENFVQGSVKVRADGFRSDIEELPSFSGYRGRSPLLTLGHQSLVHTGDLHAEYLRRRERVPQDIDGDGIPDKEPNPFALPATFPDGLGNREALRVDTTQALELPVALGHGWKLTPFVSARGTAWSEGADPNDSPTRLVAEAGARLGTTFWKFSQGGKLSQFAPFVELRSEIDRNDHDGTPIAFDSVENVLSGDFMSFGAQSRFGVNGGVSLLDLDLTGTYASDRSDGQDNGWLPLEVIGRLRVTPLGHDLVVFHDGRYDIEEHQTVYSLFALGTGGLGEWGFQASHQRGRDSLGDALFEVASVAALYRWTEKWEFEAGESFSLLEDQKLDTNLVLRRYGHDIVLDIETSVREGEGSTVSISFRPRFAYRPERVGSIAY